MIELRAADIVCTRGTRWLSKAIRFFTRKVGESRTKVNHVGLIVTDDPMDKAILVEALETVKRHGLWQKYAGSSNEVAIFRPLNLTDEEREIVRTRAETYVGRKYGFLKILTHALDWTLQGAYVFRRLTNSDNYPICSWVVAHAYASIGKDFGVDAGAATPDDIWDFCTGNPDKYALIVPLGKLKD